MKIKNLISFLEEIAPLTYQESYDNAGLITGNPDWNITGVLVCLDSIEAVVDEAVAKKCNLIISHHPIIFRGLKKISGRDYIEKTIIKAIKNDIAIYAIHTNLDNVLINGVNSKIAEKLGLINTRILKQNPNQQNPEIGAGLVGDLEEAVGESEFLQFLKETMETSCVRHTAFLNKKIKKVALCGGAGSFLLREAIKTGADIYISGDFKYHEFFDANNRILIADIGHFESEQFTIQLLFDIISKKFINFATHFTKVNTNPVNYLK